MLKNIGFLIYPQAQPMDILGPWEVLATWKKLAHPEMNLLLISESGGLVHCDNGITLQSHQQFDTCPNLDCLVVPGGQGRVEQVERPAVLQFMQQQAAHCHYILSICTGAFLLHRAGLLHGQAITTYWRALPELKAYTDIKIVEERIVSNTKVWASGGISSGIDLALAFIQHLAGKATAGKVQLLFEYLPNPGILFDANTANELPPYYSNPGDAAPLPKYLQNALAPD